MSDKMLYKEVKERESILQTINATVSHELRNPLNAIIDQNKSLAIIIQILSQIIINF